MADTGQAANVYTWSPKGGQKRGQNLYQARQILYYSVWKDIKVRYKQTTLGILWVVIQPLMTMLIFYHVIFGSGRLGFPMAKGSQAVPLYIGITIWNMCLSAIASGSTALLNNQSIITKVYFPRQIPILACTLTALFDFGAGIALLPPMAYVTDTPFNYLGFLLALLLMIPLCIFLHVTCMFLASVIVRFRDVKILVPFILTLLFFLSTVFIPAQSYVAKFRGAVLINPIAIVIDTFRHLCIGTPSAIGASMLLRAVGLSLVLLVGARLMFTRAERLLSDIL
jgi:lipopolysaccharide transport system permease protein